MRDDGWKEEALCAQVDGDLFFPEKGGSTKDARKVCSGCPVKVECLEESLLAADRFGVRGGITERTRRAAVKRVSAGEDAHVLALQLLGLDGVTAWPATA